MAMNDYKNYTNEKIEDIEESKLLALLQSKIEECILDVGAKVIPQDLIYMINRSKQFIKSSRDLLFGEIINAFDDYMTKEKVMKMTVHAIGLIFRNAKNGSINRKLKQKTDKWDQVRNEILSEKPEQSLYSRALLWKLEKFTKKTSYRIRNTMALCDIIDTLEWDNWPLARIVKNDEFKNSQYGF
jgi:hypothetical protein